MSWWEPTFENSILHKNFRILPFLLIKNLLLKNFWFWSKQGHTDLGEQVTLHPDARPIDFHT